MANIANAIEKQLPRDLIAFIREAGEVARSEGQNLYLVGGVVRDLLLEQRNIDLDLVVEGSGIALAGQLAGVLRGKNVRHSQPGISAASEVQGDREKQLKITTHPRFDTAKIEWNGWSADVTTARTETYARPGALPQVKPSTIEKDLLRRDFTVNTMAVHLNPGSFGELIDLYGGQDDLKHRLIRILHDRSFTDDATRIWRAVRYEQRLGFQIAPGTLALLQQGLPLLATISGDRIRYELECVMLEKQPEKVLRRAGELGILANLSLVLKGDASLAREFEAARQLDPAYPQLVSLYWALFFYRLDGEENERLTAFLKLPKALAQVTRDTISLKAQLYLLNEPALRPSQIYHLVSGYREAAVMANILATSLDAARQNMRLYLEKLRFVRIFLSGDDLQGMGVLPGPRVREMLERLHELGLDDKVASRADEEAAVQRWLAGKAV
jgi:tRNA nucleotidyltransferase (CCA-adding enzyme)